MCLEADTLFLVPCHGDVSLPENSAVSGSLFLWSPYAAGCQPCLASASVSFGGQLAHESELSFTGKVLSCVMIIFVSRDIYFLYVKSPPLTPWFTFSSPIKSSRL